MNKRMAWLVVVGLGGCTLSTQDVKGDKGDPGEAGPPGSDAPWMMNDAGAVFYNGGPVGIGTTDPNGLLEVRKDQDGETQVKIVEGTDSPNGAARIDLAAGQTGATSALTIAKYALGNSGTILGGIPAAGFSIIFDNSDFSHGKGLILATEGGDGGTPIILATNAEERMRIDSSGNVGIGTTNPTASLHVVDNAAGGGRVAVFESGNGDAFQIHMLGPGFGGLAAGMVINADAASGGSWYFMRGCAAYNGTPCDETTSRFAIGSAGGGFFAGGVATNGNYSINGACVLGCSSDARLKQNITPLAPSLPRLLRLRGVTFEWKEPAKHGNLAGPQIGMIAQQVEEVFPEWLGTDADGYKTLTYRGFEAPAVESLRELKADADRLGADKEALAGEVATLRTHQRDLEGKLIAERDARLSLEARLRTLEEAIAQPATPRRGAR